MKTAVAICIAVALAIGGFFIGLFSAAMLGYHESIHVFPAALVGAILAALIGFRLASAISGPAEKRQNNWVIVFAGGLLAFSLGVYFLAVS